MDGCAVLQQHDGESESIVNDNNCELEKIHQHFGFRAELLRRLSRTKSYDESEQLLFEHEQKLKRLILENVKGLLIIATTDKGKEFDLGSVNTIKEKPRHVASKRSSKSENGTERTAAADWGPTAIDYCAPASARAESWIACHLQVVVVDGISFLLRFTNVHQEDLREARNNVLDMAAIVFYCVAHLSLYELVHTVISETFKEASQHTLLNVLLLATGLILLHVSGGAIGWIIKSRIDGDTINKPNNFDARIKRWLTKRPMIKCITQVLSLYLCFVTVSYFQSLGLRVVDIRGDVLAGLPSALGESATLVGSIRLHDGLTSVPSKQLGVNLATERLLFSVDDSEDLCRVDANYTQPFSKIELLGDEDSMYLWTKLSVTSYYAFKGSMEVPLVSSTGLIAYFGACAALCIYLLDKLGCPFWS